MYNVLHSLFLNDGLVKCQGMPVKYLFVWTVLNNDDNTLYRFDHVLFYKLSICTVKAHMFCMIMLKVCFYICLQLLKHQSRSKPRYCYGEVISGTICKLPEKYSSKSLLIQKGAVSTFSWLHLWSVSLI